MSRKPRQFRYGDDDSQAFLEGVIQSAPRQHGGAPVEQMETATTFQPREEWTSEVYHRLDGGQQATPKHGCFSCTVLLYSILVAFAGVGVIVMGYLQDKRHWIALCPNCDNVILGLYIAGGVIVCFGVLGIAAAVVRIKCLAIPYMLIVMLLGLLFLAGGALCVVIQNNLDNINLLPLWQSTTSSIPNFICATEGNLQCSGFSSNWCCVTNTSAVPYLSNVSAQYCYISGSNASYDATTWAVVTWPSQVCVANCANNIYRTTCDVAIRNEIKSNIIPIAASMIPFGVLSIIVGVFSVCMTRKTGAYR